ncbi:MarR family transcriptional regulator, partial [bacterium]|nr:MarR family transcriptional regulator [bacterium]
MDKNIDLYLTNQTEQAKLIYTIGILWSQISTKLETVLAKYNLNIAKFNILMIIKHIGGKQGIQQNEISKRLLVTASNITKLLDKLEKDGMITRNSKENDRRVKLILITDFASEILDDAWKIYQKEV